ncbi:MAG: PD-(D/E)XK nuclease family protein [Phycisphaeraceae bacterium]
MASERHFLGWADPALPGAVAWFAARYGEPRGWDLHGLLIAVPVARAGRRLLELLTEAMPGGRDAAGALTPPRLCTIGELPDWLAPPPPGRRIAPDSRTMLARVAALRAADRDQFTELIAHPPDTSDVMAWWHLADRLRRLTDELAGGGLTLDDVLDLHARGQLGLPRPERWQVLRDIDHAYHAKLADDRLVDRARHRLDTLRHQRCRCEHELILLGAPDLDRLTRAMLDQLDTNITVLVHAPDDHAAGFDHLGAFVPGHWHDQPVPLDDDTIRMVGRTTDQPAEVGAAIVAMNEQRERASQPPLAADQITVGLADQTQGGAIRRALQRTGAPARAATGHPLEWTPPAMLLTALASFAEHHRLDAFAQLVRHPDVAEFLRDKLGPGHADVDWLTLLDEYISRYLRAELAEEALLRDEKYAALARAYRAIAALLPPGPRLRRPLPRWARTISEALAALYQRRQFSWFEREQEKAIVALQAIGDVLREHSQLEPRHDTTPRLTLAEAMRLVIAEAQSRTIPEPGGEPAIELLGFYELPMDDAAAIVIASFNEQHIPQSPRGDAFLPDTLRGALGLPTAVERYARDKLLLLASLQGREHIALIAPRSAAEGDPLTPSRLLLACDEATQTHRIRRFYDDEFADATQRRYTLLTPGKQSRFLIPHPGAAHEPIDKLHVTAFRDYLDCPYRFFLRHVRKLEPSDDRATELDAAQFGSVAHDVLEAFAREGPSDSPDPQRIADFLREALDERFRQWFGTRLRPALLIQRQQIQERFEAFAHCQAKLAEQGWRIKHAEQRLETPVAIDGIPFTLVGKIDRIDVHGELGYRIIDYKTGDTARKPHQSHRGRITRTHRPPEERDAEGWVDLQLPLYLDIVEQAHDIPRQDMTLAQLNLPRKLEDVGLHVAEWDADTLSEAQAVRDWVVRQIRAARFWPPQDPKGWPDEFTWLCADDALDRRQLIRDSALKGGEGDV